MVRRQLQKRRGCLGCLGVVVALFLCFGVTSVVVDRLCYSGLSQRLPYYPGAVVRSTTHNLFSNFGMGNTVVVLETDDDYQAVTAWYGRETGDYIRNSISSPDLIVGAARRIAQGQWSVTRQEDGTGSQIILFGTCANG